MSIQKKSLHADIFDTLRDRIVYLEYPPGMPLIEKDLCEEFKVSRTPLREAIRKLEEVNLATVIPRYGSHVSAIDINEIRCAFEVKIRLEGLATSAAARRITPDKLAELAGVIQEVQELKGASEVDQRALISLDAKFHEIIYQACQNPILREFLENLHSRCARLWNSSLSTVATLADIIDQLQSIYLALKDRQAEVAGRLGEEHVQYFINKLKAQLL
jgi:GntR family transcriptional regulator, rspAB operon transcriptional repressor